MIDGLSLITGMLKEKELKFIEKNGQEHQTLEYKLRPNHFNIDGHIKKYMHCNIKKIIYAFANTKGGVLYVGVCDKHEDFRTRIIGIEKIDTNKIIDVIKGVVNNTPIQVKGERILIEEKRNHVVKITVGKLEFFNKPQLLDGILYYRVGDSIRRVESFPKEIEFYHNYQIYLFLTKGIERNLQNLFSSQNLDIFKANQFLDGLKYHIEEFGIDNNVDDNKMTKVISLLNQIKRSITKIADSKTEYRPTLQVNMESTNDIDKDINKFVNTYREIIGLSE